MLKNWVLRHRTHLLLSMVFFVALGLRIAHFAGQWESNPLFLAPNMDERKHHEWAQLLASGQTLGPKPFFRAPLYYVTLAAIYKAAGPHLPLARLVGCLIGSGTCLLIALLGQRLDRPSVGIFAGLLAAVYWPYIHFDQLLLSVGLETFLGMLLLLVMLAAARRGEWWRYCVVGAVWGLSAITRPTTLTFAPMIALWVWHGERLSSLVGRADSTWSKRVRNLALVVVAAGVVIAPVTLYNRAVGGEWVLIATNGGVNFFIGNNARADGVSAVVPGTRTDWDGGYEDTHAIAQRAHPLGTRRTLTEGEVSDYWYRQAWVWIRSEPVAAFKLFMHKLALFWTPVEIPNNNAVWFFARRSPLVDLYWVGFAVVAVLGMAGLPLLGRTDWRLWCLPVAYGLTCMITVVAFFVVDRYRLPAIPVLMLAAGICVDRIPRLCGRRHLVTLISCGVVAVLTSIGIALSRPGAAFWPTGRHFFEQEEALGNSALGNYYLELAAKQAVAPVEAVPYFQAAVNALPLSPDEQLSLGIAMLQSRVPDLVKQAGTPLERAIGLQPASASARRYYARWLVRQGRRKDAIAQYRAVIELQPWGRVYQEALLALGQFLRLEGQDTQAGAYLLKALQNDPDDPVAVVYLAETVHALRSRGATDEASALLVRGTTLVTDPRTIQSALRDVSLRVK